MTREVLKQALEALENIDNWLPTIGQKGLRDYEADAITAIRAALAEPEQEPVAWPSRRAVELAIESVENPKGMHLNDGKERVILPGGTLRYMLALIDRTSTPKRQPLTDEQIDCLWLDSLQPRI